MPTYARKHLDPQNGFQEGNFDKYILPPKFCLFCQSTPDVILVSADAFRDGVVGVIWKGGVGRIIPANDPTVHPYFYGLIQFYNVRQGRPCRNRILFDQETYLLIFDDGMTQEIFPCDYADIYYHPLAFLHRDMMLARMTSELSRIRHS